MRHAVVNGQLRHMMGWHRDSHDPRDTFIRPMLESAIPSKGSVRTIYAPPIRDQSNIGSCTANGGVEAAGFITHVENGLPDPMYSRLDLYAITRKIEGTPLTEDSGCQVRDVFKAMAQYGVCLEQMWPYDTEKFSMMPPRTAMTAALKHKAILYAKAATLLAIKSSIVDPTQPTPLIGGFVCYESLQSDAVSKTGDVPMPEANEQSIGGHCIYFDGFDDDADDGCGGKGMLNFRNSWGEDWGDGGCGRLPYAYVTSGFASDFWRITKNAA